MKAAAEDVARKALELDEQERAELAALLLESLEKADPEAEAAWVAEIERRAAEMESGAVKGIPWEEVRAGLLRTSGGS